MLLLGESPDFKPDVKLGQNVESEYPREADAYLTLHNLYELSLRVSFAVVFSSIIQARDEAYDPTNAYEKKWMFFPDWYYLGGLRAAGGPVGKGPTTNISSNSVP
ncbi:hypothetical protein DVH05_027673 [Phytophthora capsici]|nr:hypothetical protein DVH05_027673 [Phytophthora capsici]